MIACIIPAKGYSSRIPGKNIRDFHGKPIIAYSIASAKASGLFDTIVVSTDDDAVSEVAQAYGADVIRRAPVWSEDCYGPLDVARHTLELMNNVDIACVLYATAPLMAVADLVRGYHAVKRKRSAYAMSIGNAPFLHDAAQFFWCRSYALKERLPEFSEHTVLVPIDETRDCDINVEADWLLAERMYNNLTNRLS